MVVPDSDEITLENSTLPKSKITSKLVLLTSFAAIGGFVFGYDTGVISGANLYLKIQFSLNTIQQEVTIFQLVVCVTIAASAVFSLVGGILSHYIGRKWTIVSSSVLYIIGLVVQAATPQGVFAQLLVGRVIVGIAIGLCSTVTPVYIAECAPPKVRGVLITMFHMMLTFGQFVASVIDAAFSYIKNDNINWRLMLVFPVIPAIIQFLGFLFMPESPRWLVSRGKDEQAYKILTSINGGDEDAATLATIELNEIKAAQRETERARREAGGKNMLLAMLESPTIRKALIIGSLLQMFQQLSGINNVMYYGATIIQMGGISNATQAIWMASITSGVNFVCTFVAVYLVDKIGRRKLLLGSVIGVTFTLILLGIGFLVIKIYSPEAYYIENNSSGYNDSCSQIKNCDTCSYKTGCGFCFDDTHNASYTGACVAVYDDINHTLRVANTQWANYGRCQGIDVPNSPMFVDPNAQWDYGFCPTPYSFLPIIGMVLYLCSFSSGFGPTPRIICAEIFPTWARSTGTAITSASNWLFNLVISLTYLTISENLGRSNAFFLYAGITFIAIVFCYLVIPETNHKKMEDIDALLRGPFLSCGKVPQH